MNDTGFSCTRICLAGKDRSVFGFRIKSIKKRLNLSRFFILLIFLITSPIVLFPI